MAVSGNQFTRIGAGVNSISKRVVITPKAVSSFTSVENSSNLRWDIFNHIINSNTYNWDIYTEIVNSSDLRWDIYALINNSSNLSWDIRNQILQSLQTNWDINSLLINVPENRLMYIKHNDRIMKILKGVK